jgi:hypothetical protein
VRAILVSTGTTTRVHLGSMRQTRHGAQWVQDCGMSRGQTYYGTEILNSDWSRFSTWADAHPTSRTCAKCFPGRVLPDKT